MGANGDRQQLEPISKGYRRRDGRVHTGQNLLHGLKSGGTCSRYLYLLCIVGGQTQGDLAVEWLHEDVRSSLRAIAQDGSRITVADSKRLKLEQCGVRTVQLCMWNA